MRADLLEFVLEEFAEKSGIRGMEENDCDGYSTVGTFRDTEPSLGEKWLLERGVDLRDSGDSLRFASAWVQDERRAAVRRYQRTAKGRAAAERYRTSPKGLETIRRTQREKDRRRTEARRLAKANAGRKEAA